MLPITALIASIGYWLAARWHGRGRGAAKPAARPALLGGLAAGIFLVILGFVASPYLGPEANRANVTSVGTAIVERGAALPAGSDGADAGLRVIVENRNAHRTPLPPHDSIDLIANVPGADGAAYEIRATQPMIADSKGRFTTSNGVGFGKWHDGRSGIGLSRLPPTQSDVLAYALASVSADGRLIATGVPIQVMATDSDPRRLELRVGDRDSPSSDNPVPYFRVVWQDFAGGYSHTSKYARYVFGGVVLLFLLGFAFAAARRERDLS